ncbi:MAG: DUF11 domain-containing protein [Myxococcales bacterium]|nr:DUF11 domain-containing protein [Myxococcales bacterium]
MKKTTIHALGLLLGVSTGCGSAESLPFAVLPGTAAEPQGTRSQANFVNGDFENGTLSGWTLTTHVRPPIVVYPPTKFSDLGLMAGGVNLTRIGMAAAPESVVPTGLAAGDSLKFPRFGMYTAVINEGGSTNNANVLRQEMTTTLADIDPIDNKIHIRFALAPILQDGAHAAEQQAYFFTIIRNETKNTDIYSTFNFANQPGIPYKTSVGNAAYRYTDWQLFDWAPGPVGIAVGDRVSVTLVASRCSPSGHAGQLLVDGFGAFLPALTVVASGPQAVNVSSNIAYNFNVRNGSKVGANNVVVRERIPMGTTFVSVMGATCAGPDAGGYLSCDLGMMGPDEVKNFQVIVQAPATAQTVVNGEYTIQSTGVSPLIGPPVRTNVTAGVNYTDLVVTASSNVPAADAGEPVEYVVTVKNNGPTATPMAAITNMLPPGLMGATWMCTAMAGATCAMASGTGALSTTANLPVGGSVTYVVRGTIGAGALPRMDYVVSAAPGGTILDGDYTNNAAQASTAVGPTQLLSVSKGNSTGTGTIASRPDGILCDTNCTMQDRKFSAGSTVILTATPDAGNTFAGWGGACASAGLMPTCTLKLDAASQATANFISGMGPAGNADLQVVVRDNLLGKLPANGAPVRYTVDVSNAGPDPVFGGMLGTSLPTNLGSVTWTCMATGGAACPVAAGSGPVPASVSLLPGGKLTYVVSGVASAMPVDPMIFSAAVQPPQNSSDPNGNNNSASSIVGRQQNGDLSIVLTKSPDSAKPGETTTYTAQVANSGPDTILQPQVVINLPPGAQVLMPPAGDGWTCSRSVDTYTCTRDSAVPGMLPPITAQIVTPVPVKEGGPGSTVIGTVGAPLVNDPNPTNNTAIVDATKAPVANADLQLAFTKNPTPSPLGQETTYTALLSNKGPATAQSPSVTMTLPPGSVVTSFTPGEGWSCVRNNLTFSCLRSSLAPGDAPPIVVTAVTPMPQDGSMNGGSVVGEATAIQLQDPNPLNNVASISAGAVPMTGSDLSVTLSRDPDSAMPGGIVNYTLQASNKGPDAVDDVRVSLVLPPGAEVVMPPAGDGWTCTQNLHTYVCSRPRLAVGDAPPLVAQIRLPQGADPSIFEGEGGGTATIGAPNNTDPNETDNVSSLPGALYKLSGGGLGLGCSMGQGAARTTGSGPALLLLGLAVGMASLRSRRMRRIAS